MIEKLLLFGLGRQEAGVYLCLLKKGELTGYEVSKLTGISRSNVYHSLAALVEHGAAYIIEGTSTKYTAVSMEEFCDNRIRYLAEVKKDLLRNCPRPAFETEGYITIEGAAHIRDKIHHMLLGTGQRVYFSAEPAFLEQWREEINALLQRKIKVVLISCSLPKGLEDQVAAGRIIFYKSRFSERESVPENGNRHSQVRIIIDSAYVLTGEISGSAADTCLYSAQKNFVEVFKEAMHNEIRLIELCAEVS